MSRNKNPFETQSHISYLVSRVRWQDSSIGEHLSKGFSGYDPTMFAIADHQHSSTNRDMCWKKIAPRIHDATNILTLQECFFLVMVFWCYCEMFLKIMAIWTTFIKPWKLGIHSAKIDAVENLRFCAPLFRAVLHSFSQICTAGKLRRLVVSQHLIVSLPVILLPAPNFNFTNQRLWDCWSKDMLGLLRWRLIKSNLAARSDKAFVAGCQFLLIFGIFQIPYFPEWKNSKDSNRNKKTVPSIEFAFSHF